MSQGIYIIKNDINNKVYIGQSIYIEKRWKQHLWSALSQKSGKSYFSKLHTAMRDIGVEHFYYEILEIVQYNKQLTEREKHYINQYNSIINGYNSIEPTDSNWTEQKGERNGRALLTVNDVIAIRTMYNNHIPFRDVYKLYQNIISKRGLQKVWHQETWKDIMPEVYTEENKLWHKTKSKGFEQQHITNEERQCKPEEIEKMYLLYKQGLNFDQIAKKLGRAKSTVNSWVKFKIRNES